MLKQFKEFAMRGNVMDLAIAVVLGAAFGAIINSLVEDIIMPFIGLLLGGVDFTSLSFQVNEAVINYGLFLQSIVDFTIISFSIFVFIYYFNKMKKKKEEEPVKEENKSELLLEEIRDLLKSKN